MIDPSIQLASGKLFHFYGCRPEDIDINDIASHLSKLCRFTGAVRQFYSVAQHSVLVSAIVPPEHALAGLLHDATEAYINDLSRPAKSLAAGYCHYEKYYLWPVIAKRFGLPQELPACVKEADNVLLVTEKRDLMPPIAEKDRHVWAWADGIVPLGVRIQPLMPGRAEAYFRHRWFQLTGEKI